MNVIAAKGIVTGKINSKHDCGLDIAIKQAWQNHSMLSRHVSKAEMCRMFIQKEDFDAEFQDADGLSWNVEWHHAITLCVNMLFFGPPKNINRLHSNLFQKKQAL